EPSRFGDCTKPQKTCLRSAIEASCANLTVRAVRRRRFGRRRNVRAGMMRGRWFVALALVVLQAPRESAAGRIGVVPSRPDTLYSGSNANPSCTDLFNVQDDTMLPLNVVRLRAQQPAGVAPDQVRYQWSFPKP